MAEEGAPLLPPKLEATQRRVFLRQGSGTATPGPFPDNLVQTAKYTPYNFVPKNLWEQLHKFGNVYFLLISVLMYLGEHTNLFIGTIKAFSTFATLLAMMSITALVALLDDYRRHQADAEMNSQKTRVMVGSKPQEKQWQDVCVADVLIIRKNEEFPADIVPLYCSGEEGTCYVSTANLDGETNLKLKSAAPVIQSQLANHATCGDVKSVLAALESHISMVDVVAESPSNSIHTFQGNITSCNSSTEPLSAEQLLLRGTVLRNTDFCVGVVVYTGSQTRMVMNSKPAPLKQSNIECVTNRMLLMVLLAQGVLALASAMMFMHNQESLLKHWYLYPPDLLLPDCVSYWLTFFVLYSNLMPISLYPTMEWCNSFQTYFIKNDEEMYWPELKFPAGARSSNLSQELGQVGYVFSDKTGTLTQNVMDLKQVWIAGQVYGERTEEKGFHDKDGTLKAAQKSSLAEPVDNFLEVLAVSHTVMVTKKDDGALEYEAESPDESALVETASQLGWSFVGRQGATTLIRKNGQELNYKVHGVNAFNSTRKRMSVVVEVHDEKFLLVKGADNVMLERAAEPQKDLEQALTRFSTEGLRTLVIGRRRLDPVTFDKWHTAHERAQNIVSGQSSGGQTREDALAEAAESIEKDLDIVGATAIEDKLQARVPETIQMIRTAGINLWVLTGDKLETAKNIGFSANVLDESMVIAELDFEGGEHTSGDINAESAALRTRLEALKDKLHTKGKEERALMVTGPALDIVFREEGLLQAPGLKAYFLDVAKDCSIVMACRVSPLQKALMVKLVREGIQPAPVTLAVGDGANDVPMIQEAQVGIGIAGREGRQAVNNSDFAIGQFSYLQRLLLVHGRWNYRRICKFTLYTFWRNGVQVLMIFYYTFVSGFSGTSLFEDWIRLSFNFLCSFPIMATGCFDQDVSAEIALEHPKLYEFGRLGLDLNLPKILQTQASAVIHSLLLLGVTACAFPGMDILGAGDYYTFGTAVYTCLLIDMNYRVAFLNFTHNQYTLGSIALSFGCYVLFLMLYPCNKLIVDMLAPNMYMVPVQFLSRLPFWLCIIVIPALATNIDMLFLIIFRKLSSRTEELARYRQESWKKIIAGEGHSHLIPGAEDATTIAHSTFSQQRNFGLSFDGTHLCMRIFSFLIGLMLMATGLYVLDRSESVGQFRIQYAGTHEDEQRMWWSINPWGTRPDEVLYLTDKCRTGPGSVCKATITLPRAMEPPILLYYAVGPFYQNYNDYLVSEVPKELMGLPVSEADRALKCPESTRLTANGENIVPCGMKAKSTFNDTFKVGGHKIHDADLSGNGIAWESDVDRYRNPPGYPDEPNDTWWLYQSYPKLIKKEDGVKNRHFVEWMRPDAMPYVWKDYGYLHEKLSKGTNLSVEIESNYPVEAWGGYKQLVLTEVNELGARHNGFAYVLLGSGGFCVLLSLFVCVLHAEQCSRLPASNRNVQARTAE